MFVPYRIFPGVVLGIQTQPVYGVRWGLGVQYVISEINLSIELEMK